MRNILESFPTERIQICDKDKHIILETFGLFGKTGLTITDVSIPIIEGQLVLRFLPNGYLEEYEVTESRYIKGHGNICDYYKLSLTKINLKNTLSEKNVYNDYSIHIGDNTKIDKSIINNIE